MKISWGNSTKKPLMAACAFVAAFSSHNLLQLCDSSILMATWSTLGWLTTGSVVSHPCKSEKWVSSTIGKAVLLYVLTSIGSEIIGELSPRGASYPLVKPLPLEFFCIKTNRKLLGILVEVLWIWHYLFLSKNKMGQESNFYVLHV
jgi:hypothetical protein